MTGRQKRGSSHPLFATKREANFPPTTIRVARKSSFSTAYFQMNTAIIRQYLLNPDGTSHAPFSKDGCTLFVKLRQYGGEGRTQVEMNAGALDWQPRNDTGVWQKPLYRQGGYREWTQLLKLDPGAQSPPHEHPNGEEVFVIDGAIEDEFGAYPAGTWIRYPPGSSHTVKSLKGAILYVRLGGIAEQ